MTWRPLDPRTLAEMAERFRRHGSQSHIPHLQRLAYRDAANCCELNATQAQKMIDHGWGDTPSPTPPNVVS